MDLEPRALIWLECILAFLAFRYLKKCTSAFLLTLLLCFTSLLSLPCQSNRRETRIIGILTFIHSTVWKALFGKVVPYAMCILRRLGR